MEMRTISVVRDPETSWCDKIVKRISDTPLRIHRKGFELLQRHFMNKSEYYEKVAEEEKQQSEYFAQAAEQSETEQGEIKNKEHSFDHERKYENFIEKLVFYRELSQKVAKIKDMFTKEIGNTSVVQSETEIENENINESVAQEPAPQKIDLSGLPEINIEEENAKLDEQYVIEDERTFEEIYAQVCALLGEDSDLKSDLDALLSLEEDENKKEALFDWIENNFAFDLSNEMNAKMYAILDDISEEEVIMEMNDANKVDNEETKNQQEDEEVEEITQNDADSYPTELTEDVDNISDDAGEFADEVLESEGEEVFETPVDEEITEEPQTLEQAEVETKEVDGETILHGNNFYGANFEEDLNNPNENPEDIKWLVDEVNKAYEDEYQQELTDRLTKAEDIFKTDNLSEEQVEKIEKSVAELLHNKYEINSDVDAFRDELLSQGFNEDTEENKKNLDYILGLKRELEEEKKLTGEKSERVRELQNVINEKIIGLKPEIKELEQTSEVEEINEEQTFEQPVIEGWEEAIQEPEEVEEISETEEKYIARIAELEKAIEIATQEKEEAEKRAQAAEIAEGNADEAKKNARKEKNQAKDELKKTKKHLVSAEKERDEYKTHTIELRAENSELRTGKIAAEKRAKSAEEKVAALEMQNTAKDKEIAELKNALSGTEKKLDKVSKQLEKMIKVLGLDTIVQEDSEEYEYGEESSEKTR